MRKRRQEEREGKRQRGNREGKRQREGGKEVKEVERGEQVGTGEELRGRIRVVTEFYIS